MSPVTFVLAGPRLVTIRYHEPKAFKTFPLPLMPKSPDEIVDAVAAAITPKTKLLFFSHVYAATGIIVPAKELCDFAQQRGIISVVDGAHAPAVIPLRINDLDCDFYAGNGHKWLCGPKGSAVLWLLQWFGPACYPVYVGDDVTDEDAFRVLRDRGATVLVGPPGQETLAHHRLDDPRAVRDLLERIAASPAPVG